MVKVTTLKAVRHMGFDVEANKDIEVSDNVARVWLNGGYAKIVKNTGTRSVGNIPQDENTPLNDTPQPDEETPPDEEHEEQPEAETPKRSKKK